MKTVIDAVNEFKAEWPKFDWDTVKDNEPCIIEALSSGWRDGDYYKSGVIYIGGSKCEKEHQPDHSEDDADRQDLGPEEALEHVVIEHDHSGQVYAILRMPEFIGQIGPDGVEKRLSIKRGVGFEDSKREIGRASYRERV